MPGGAASPARSRGCSSRWRPRCRLASRPRSRMAERQDRQDLVAVDDVAVVVDGQAAVGVAVEREADVGAVLEHGRAAARSRWVEPQPSLMLRPSGSAWIAITVGAGVAQRPRPDVGGRAVGAVEHDPQAGQRVVERCATRWAAYSSTAVAVRRDPADVGAGRAVPLLARGAPRSRASIASSSLTPPRARNLMPLSGIGLWEAREHHAEVGAERARSGRRRRGRQHAEQQHVDPGRGQAGHDGGLEELPRDRGCPGRRRPAGRCPSNSPRLGRARGQRRRRGPGPARRSDRPLARPRTPSVPKSRAHRPS